MYNLQNIFYNILFESCMKKLTSQNESGISPKIKKKLSSGGGGND